MWNIDWLSEQEDTCLPLQQSVSQLTVITQLVPKPYVGLSFYEKTLHVILSSSPNPVLVIMSGHRTISG